MGGPADNADLVASLRSAAPPGGRVEVVEMTTTKVMGLERMHGSKLAPAKSASVHVDSAFTTGLPLTSPVSADNKTEVAWSIWDAARHGRSKRDTVVVVGPRVLPYLPSIMRIDPCARIALVGKTDPRDISSNADALSSTLAISREDAAEYIEAFLGAAHQLASSFPKRVGSALTPAKAAQVTFDIFAQLP
jgi:hypothetical protein